MTYPTELTAADWGTLGAAFTGASQCTPDVVSAAYNAHGLALGNIMAPSPPSPAPCPCPCMPKAAAAKLCRDMVAAKGAKASHKAALGTFNWQAFLQAILALFAELFPAVAPVVP
jgi:hypothetical protein